MSQSYFISHSELWAVASARLLGSTDFVAIPLYYKPLFYVPLHFFYFFDLSNTQHILLARAFFSIIGSIGFGLFLVETFQLGAIR